MTGESKTEIRKGTCPVCNAGACHVNVHFVDDKIVKLTGDTKSPMGKLCPRVSSAVDYHYHPERLNYPLKRIGARGEGRWQRVGWEQAMDEIAQKLDKIRDKFGPEAVAAFGGGGNRSSSDPAAWRWCNLWGTPNYFWQGKNCGQSEFLAECAIYGYLTMGPTGCTPVPGVTKSVLIWGRNPWASQHHGWQKQLDAQKAGAKLVVIDPRFTESAEAADIWLQIRPGTDGALAYGMLNVIIGEGLYDRDFVEKWCLGFDELRILVQKYNPEMVEGITWIPKEQILEVARLYATGKPSIITGGLGPRHTGTSGLSGVVGKCLLRAITGNLEVEGGQRFSENPEKTRYLEELHMDKLIGHPLRTRDNVSAHVWPMASVKALELFREAQNKLYPRGVGISTYYVYPGSRYIWSAILEEDPYPMKAVFLQTSNPLLVLGNAKRIYEALKSPNLDLFVVAERWMTPSAQLADYVLPAADNLERISIDNSSVWGFHDARHGRQQAESPLYERRDDYYIWRDLGKRLGQAEYWEDTLEQWFDKLLEPTGITFAQLADSVPGKMDQPEPKGYEKKGFATFSGKVELKSSFFEKMGVNALSDFEEPAHSPVSTPELAGEYPFILITGGRNRIFHHSQHRQIQELRRQYQNPVLQIHPEAARKLGINDGDSVYIETNMGRVTQIASLTEGIDPRVVHADGFWWYPEKQAEDPCLFGVWESNINAILPDDPEVCDYAGNNYFRAMLCKVYVA